MSMMAIAFFLMMALVAVPSTAHATNELSMRLRQSIRRLSPSSKITCRAKGTMLFFGDESPSDEKLAKWFYEAREPNHNSAGMTNPTLHYTIDEMCKVQQVSLLNNNNRRESTSSSGAWWPSLPSTKDGNWRVLRYTQRVGRGMECYQSVRDCCLDWQFSSNTNGDSSGRGIRAVKAPARRMVPRQVHSGAGYDIVHNELDVEDRPCSTSESCLQIGPGRRLATYAETRLPFGAGNFLPKLQVYNPGCVVYDVVDQRGPGTTYTSTAFGTLTGHWLQGEERVTVAVRDDPSQAVDVEIVSYSRPSPGVGRIVWPFISRLQNRFFQSQLRSIAEEAEKAPQRTLVRPQQIGPSQVLPSEL
mmetsp:Transcript_26558/g.38841  ORF Transcript_26558/g.38841 Transcript_26558/m.38841 type:complete len:359 (-) Transcript_26558:348-1424(-)